MPGPVFLPGDAVDLHTIEEADLGFLQRGVNDPQVWRAIDRAAPANGPQERGFFEDVVSGDGTVNLLVCADGTPVGTVDLHAIDERAGRAEVGYWVAPDSQRRGYGSEAVALLVTYAFEHRRLHRVAARVVAGNDASRALLAGLGFAEEGVHREAEFVDGAYRDVYWYGVLAEEWDAGGDGTAGG
jgi:RimJ/RimL family protein N-acetyltransferase